MGAIGNEPRSRHEGVAWVGVDGNFWLFGGYSGAPGIFGTMNDWSGFYPMALT